MDTMDKVVELNSPDVQKLEDSKNTIEKRLMEFLKNHGYAKYHYNKSRDSLVFAKYFFNALVFVAKNQKEILNFIKLYK